MPREEPTRAPVLALLQFLGALTQYTSLLLVQVLQLFQPLLTCYCLLLVGHLLPCMISSLLEGKLQCLVRNGRGRAILTCTGLFHNGWRHLRQQPFARVNTM